MVREHIRFFVVVALSAACWFVPGCGKGGSDGGKKDQSGGEGGANVGACKNVPICTLIPMAQVNTSLGVTATQANPETTSDAASGLAFDRCSYTGLETHAHTRVDLGRQCYSQATMASDNYEASKQAYLPREGTRTDLTGVGDRAFYEIKPTVADIAMGPNVTWVRLIALKGNLNLTLEDAVVPADQASRVKEGLTALARTILDAK